MQFGIDEGCEDENARQADADDLVAAPALVAGHRERIEHHGCTNTGGDEANEVEAVLRVLLLMLLEEAEADDQTGDADGKVDVEDPAPAHVLDQKATEDRTDHRAEEHRDRHDRDGLDALGAG